VADQTLLEGAFLERLERLALVTRRRVSGQGKGDRRSIHKGTSIEFVDYRHYTPGARATSTSNSSKRKRSSRRTSWWT
jgi:hypothetical protein